MKELNHTAYHPNQTRSYNIDSAFALNRGHFNTVPAIYLVQRRDKADTQ
ncbi:hypothetical protein SAMN02745866_00006 [Alteromonadaceae bacterium Bs31]|nr:hypothetical protein SAMN02745866_00006 [Alteromonadaceae bacterium Bs31]